MRFCDSRKDVQDVDKVLLIVFLWNAWERKWLGWLLIDFKVDVM